MTATIGHNGVAGDRLRSIVERYERLEQEVKDLRSDQKDILTEAVSAGFDKKVIRALIAERRKDAAEVEEHQALLELYRNALGDFAGTPLAQAMEPVAHA
jgi:uncharacterized protein (UPF0335 family)